MTEACPTCGREFSSERGMRVHHARAHGEKLSNRTCSNCEMKFDSEEERKYCSDECRDESVSFAGENNPNYRGGKETTECDDSFERYPSELTGEVAVYSPECQSEWLSEAFTGEGHPNWRGGDTGSYGKGWNEVRRKALERDGYECVLCGKAREEIGRNPDVHHVVPVRAFAASPDYDAADAHYLGNVVSLCVDCHRNAEFGGVSREHLRRAADDESPDAGVV